LDHERIHRTGRASEEQIHLIIADNGLGSFFLCLEGRFYSEAKPLNPKNGTPPDFIFRNATTILTNMTGPQPPKKNWSAAKAQTNSSELMKPTRRGTLVDFLSKSPLKGVALDLSRPEEKLRFPEKWNFWRW
jgi:hypothetical protein